MGGSLNKTLVVCTNYAVFLVNNTVNFIFCGNEINVWIYHIKFRNGLTQLYLITML